MGDESMGCLRTSVGGAGVCDLPEFDSFCLISWYPLGLFWSCYEWTNEVDWIMQSSFIYA